MNETLVAVLAVLVKAVIIVGFPLAIVPGLIYLERKVCSYIQGRIGPNRVNLTIGHIDYLLPPSMRGALPVGLARFKLIPGSLQPLADGIKLAFKEEIVPAQADKLLYFMAPVLAFVPVATALAFIPFGTPTWDAFGSGHLINLQLASANVGVLGLFAIASLGVYGIAVGGWGSGSKFPLMGAVRSAAQMISYEIAMALALLSAIVTAGTVDLQAFVLHQATSWGGAGWLVFKQPLAALIFLVAMFAENNRLPFDLPEAEPELVGGYHTEYSGLKFGIFFLGEYTAMILMSGLFVTLFLGGWSFPGLIDPYATGGLNALLSAGVFLAKLFLVLGFQIWIRWTLPRFRYDQLMALGWKKLVPLALANLVVSAIVLTFVS
ncbi:MAG: NADH-quinone oxidoreductase subunit H [Planctomycetes bacterium]|nr:NADH-quinone oxidoreductase subunit H [Planctomycetota bacterium]